MRSVALNPATIQGADCLMIVTDHSVIDYRMIKQHATLVVDTRNALAQG
jgi:UDP-N-acetyl-D-glucosamine dehydrogenase